MPFKSKAQQRYLESDDSPLSDEQKEEWESATDFSKLPESIGDEGFSTQMSRSHKGPRPNRSGAHPRGSHRPMTFHVPGLHVPSTEPKIQRVKNH